MPDDIEADLIWIQDAANEFGRSIPWLYNNLREKGGTLDTKKIPGDPKTYLLRSQLRELLRPQDHSVRKPQPRQE
jgi:hypothetical protein